MSTSEASTRRVQAIGRTDLPVAVLEALTDCEYVDISPSEELEAVVRHIRGG